MEFNENLVAEEAAENVEVTTEETEAQAQQSADVGEEKLIPESEFNERFDSAMKKRLARQEKKLRKEYEEKYGRLSNVVKAGLQVESLEEATDKLEEFYTGNGVEIPKKPKYSDRETEILAAAEFEEIIDAGMDEVIEEAERLNRKGADKMSKKDKAVFLKLTEYIRGNERSRALKEIGADEKLYGSEEFKEFQKKFNADTPVTEIYELFEKTATPRKEIKTPGSVKHTAAESGVKDYYTPEEISRLTEDDLKNPQVWNAVRRSMTGG